MSGPVPCLRKRTPLLRALLLSLIKVAGAAPDTKMAQETKELGNPRSPTTLLHTMSEFKLDKKIDESECAT